MHLRWKVTGNARADVWLDGPPAKVVNLQPLCEPTIPLLGILSSEGKAYSTRRVQECPQQVKIWQQPIRQSTGKQLNKG